MSTLLDVGAFPVDDAALEPIRYICVALGRRGTVRLLRELSDGYTNTRVFLAEEQVTPDDPRPFQLVFKVGPGRLLRKEVERYRALLPHIRAHNAFAALVEPERTLDFLPDSDLPGAIVYEHAAAPFALTASVSLKEQVAQAIRGEAPLGEVEEILATTIEAVGSLYGTPESDFGFLTARFYLDRWIPDFRLAVDEIAESGGQHLLTRRRLNPARFPEEPQTAAAKLRLIAESPAAAPQVDLVIPRLSPVYSNETSIFLQGPSSDVLSLEVDLTSVSWEARKKVAASRTLALWASASAADSRYGAYRRRLLEAFPDWNPELPFLFIGEQVLQNPLRHLSRPLIEHTGRARTLLVPAHGDLHSGNVLIVGTMPVIIDYGLSELRAPIGTDAARLLGSLVRDVLSELLSPEEICSVLLALLEDSSLPEEQDVPSWRAWKLLRRLQAEALRISGESLAQLWPLHLYGFAFIGLKWQATSSAQYRACGLLAAAALTKLLGRPEVEHSVQIAPGREIAPEGPAEILILVARKRDPLALHGSRNSRFSKDVIVHLTRAQTYLRESRPSEALEESRMALRLNPRCAPALTQEASCLIVLDRIPRAFESLDRAERIDPSYTSAYLVRAVIFAVLKRYAESLAMVEKALNEGIPWVLGFDVWGWSMLGLGRGEEMMAVLKSRLPASNDPDLFRLRSKYYRQKGQYVAALREVNEAIALGSEIDLRRMACYEERAKVHAGMGELALAIEDLQKAIGLCPPKTLGLREGQELLSELLVIKELEDPASRLTRLQAVGTRI